MHYVNRRNLTAVLVVGAIFGAVLPYGELWVQREWLPPVQAEADAVMSSQLFLSRKTLRFSDTVVIQKFREISGPDLKELSDYTRGIANEKLISGLVKGQRLQVEIAGWPFRSHFLMYVLNPDQTLAPDKSAMAADWIPSTSAPPVYWPRGFLWSGMAGNIGGMMVVFAAGNIVCAYWRFRRRVKKGLCWKCGYVASAAVCPECGTALREDELSPAMKSGM